jgi:phenylpyruvate tautomerase PptA (4-oxalocrotonate tautomerase family)
MPIIDLTYPEGALTAEQRETVTAELTTNLLAAEGAPDTDFFADVTWIFVHELPGTHVINARKPAVSPKFLIEVTTPEGALSNRRRKQLVADATKTVMDGAGIDKSAGMSVMVLCKEIAEGSWGAFGQVVEFEKLRETAIAEREKTATAVS